jgi:hypothetical protein
VWSVVLKYDQKMPEKELPKLNDLREVNRQCTLVVQLYLVAFGQRHAKTRYNTL